MIARTDNLKLKTMAPWLFVGVFVGYPTMMLVEHWDAFLGFFCGAGLVCSHGQPNWLGWGMLGWADIAIASIAYYAGWWAAEG